MAQDKPGAMGEASLTGAGVAREGGIEDARRVVDVVQ